MSLKNMMQKRPDVHKIVLSTKSRSPPPGKSVKFEDLLLICTVFPHFGGFSGGVEPNFADKNFTDTQTFLNDAGLVLKARGTKRTGLTLASSRVVT